VYYSNNTYSISTQSSENDCISPFGSRNIMDMISLFSKDERVRDRELLTTEHK
jgi:hypothetical protein